MTDAEIEFVTPASLSDVFAALRSPGGMLVGGGTSVALLLKNRLIEPEQLIWIGALSELSGISQSDDGAIHLGATTTLREIVRSSLLQDAVPVLPEAAGKVGNPRVRSVATLGGAVVHADPRQDLPPVLLSLRARLSVQGPSGDREIGLDELYLGFMEVSLAEDEILTKVTVPSRVGWSDAYSPFTPGSEDDYPTVGVAASVKRGADGRIEDAEIALGGVDASAILVSGAAAVLRGTNGSGSDLSAAAAIAADACNPGDDQRGSATYKRAMVGVWTRRTLATCLG